MVLKSNPSVVLLPIRKAEHADFLRDVFDGIRGQPIKIHRNEFVGRFIFSLRSYSEKPAKQIVPDGMTPVEIEFPDTPCTTHQKRYIYFPPEHIEQINDFLSAYFDLYFHIYFFDVPDMDKENNEMNGVEITRQMLVDSFVVGLDMNDFSKATETIKKREYRKSLKEMARLREKFLKKDYNFRKKVWVRRKKHLHKILFQDVKNYSK
jgi:hypothetical protein